MESVSAALQDSKGLSLHYYAFIDGPKTEAERSEVSAIAKFFESLDHERLTVVTSVENNGLRKQILGGLEFVARRHKAFVVLEDDVVVNPGFFKYMLSRLEAPRGEFEHVNSWLPRNFRIRDDGCHKSTHMVCWGWGAFSDTWLLFLAQLTDIEKTKFRFLDRFYLDHYGIFDNYRQIVLNRKGFIETWAIFWYLFLRQNEYRCISPSVSLCENIGFDGSGVNCRKNRISFQNKLIFLKWFEFKSVERVLFVNQLLDFLFPFKFLRRLLSYFDE